ncbi:DUF305 domain-containing protein [Cryobacterium sp. Hh11]|uniref:DUF305 domain-containing protein n=1 Tax=Cryobacterium sp. Hh11 TaxID=2555868 RepID=UPI00106B599C|nr:DUF305 domain-containing protein [Cryobacterium sp. Hh11]TFD50427.1 DUF305 domain-containing protein [Cryobacterium sp. Hh11]
MLSVRKFFLATAALATALTLSACSGGMAGMDMGNDAGTTDAPTASASYNEADIVFAQGMLPHHQGAAGMSDVVLAKHGIDQAVLDLATEIKAAQEPEIAQLTQWLTAWGADENGMSGMEGMDGTMSSDDMTALQNASGVEASKLFLEQMTIHHQGAVDMAQTELNDGQNADARAMATTIVTTQTDEIAIMKDILATL